MREATLRVYSGRNRPDLTPIYRLFERLTDTRVEVEMIYHLDVERRLAEERHDPIADVLVTNSQVAVEAVRGLGLFEPYAPERSVKCLLPHSRNCNTRAAMPSSSAAARPDSNP